MAEIYLPNKVAVGQDISQRYPKYGEAEKLKEKRTY